MNFEWYPVFSLTDFEESALVSKEFTAVFGARGEKTVIATLGYQKGVAFDDVFLPIQFNGENPYSFEGKAVFVDSTPEKNVFIGFEVEE